MERKMGARALQLLRARADFGRLNFVRGFAGTVDREGAENRACKVVKDSLLQGGRSVVPSIDPRRWSSSAATAHAGTVQGALKGNKADVAIIGGGIVGLATAREIVQRFPNLLVVVVEKENDLVRHQTSHNSGVIHAGIYYQPGTEMSRLCVDGARRMYKYCERKNLPHERVGKLIVATREHELPVLEDLHQRATANGVHGLELLSPKQIIDLEPNVRALRALHSPNTGIANYAKIALSYADDFLASGRGQIRTGFNAKNISADEVKGIEVQAKTGETVKSRWLITCAGLQADYVGKMAGGAKGPTVLPFRGTYHELRPEFRNLIKRNIYPVPDPA